MNFSWETLNENLYRLQIRTESTRMGTLHRITAAIYLLNLNIISGDIQTILEGDQAYSFDTFIVKFSGMEHKEMRDSIHSKLAILMEMVLGKNQSVESLFQQFNVPLPGSLDFFELKPEVLFQNDTAMGVTEFYIEAPDRKGLLYNLTELLFRREVDIVSATIRTDSNGIVQDTFHLQRNGTVLDEKRIQEIEARIKNG